MKNILRKIYTRIDESFNLKYCTKEKDRKKVMTNQYIAWFFTTMVGLYAISFLGAYVSEHTRFRDNPLFKSRYNLEKIVGEKTNTVSKDDSLVGKFPIRK